MTKADRPLFFAFLDGALTYDCISCGAKCCQGMGLGTDRERDLPRLVQLRPELAHFTTGSYLDNNVANIFNYRPSCWFLDDDLRCSIEKATEWSHKPVICKLFPFSHLRRFGAHWIVVPQLDCPLAVAPQDQPAKASSHTELEALIDEYALRHDDVPRLGPEDLPGELIELEARCLELTRPYVYGEGTSDLWAEMLAEVPLAGADLETRRRGWMRLLHVDKAPELPAATRALLAALAPGLRFHYYLDWGPRHAPVFLAALEFYLSLAHEMGNMQINAPTIQQMVSYAAPVLHILAHLEDVPRAPQPHILSGFAASAGPGPLQAVFSAVARNQTDPLGALLTPVTPFMGTMRTDILRMIGQLLAQTVVYEDVQPVEA